MKTSIVLKNLKKSLTCNNFFRLKKIKFKCFGYYLGVVVVK